MLNEGVSKLAHPLFSRQRSDTLFGTVSFLIRKTFIFVPENQNKQINAYFCNPVCL